MQAHDAIAAAAISGQLRRSSPPVDQRVSDGEGGEHTEERSDPQRIRQRKRVGAA
jgi:hypothetical protein